MERENGSKTNTKLIGIMILLSALLLRLIGLGSASLTMNEAENAVTALQLFHKGGNGQLLYIFPAAVLFKFFGSSEFTARLFPALMGCFLALIPLLLEKHIGKKKAVFLSFLFAVDPVLLFWSKQADAVIPAVTMFAAALAFFLAGKSGAAFACLLIGACGGTRFWPVLIVFLLGVLLEHLISRNNKIQKDPNAENSEAMNAVTESDSEFSSQEGPSIFNSHRNINSDQLLQKKKFFIGLLVFCLFCTGFGTFPGGFGLFARGFYESIQGAPSWLYPGAAAEVIAVLLYCGIPLFFLLKRLIRERSFGKLFILSVACVGLLLWQGIVMMPWFVLFLWCFALDDLLCLLSKLTGPKSFAFYMAAFVIPGAFAFFYFRLVELFNQVNGSELIQISMNGTIQTLPLTRFWGTVLLMAASILIIALIVKILMGFLESADVKRGILFGCMICLSWTLLTGIWNSGGFDRIGDHPAAPHLSNTVNILNGSCTSYTNSSLFLILEETISKHGDSKNTEFGLNFVTPDPMLDWYFRLYPGISSNVNTNADLSGIELILDRSDAVHDAQGFAGTKLTWRGTMDWRRLTLQEWGKWLIFGDAKLIEDTPLTLWVKADYIYSPEN